MRRLFIAAWPPPDISERLASLPVDDASGVRMVPPENWHVTLRFLGEVDAGDVAERLRAAALPTATAEIGPMLQHLGPRQIVVPVAGVDRLAAAVVRATADLGESPRRSFVGHLTVARLRKGARSRLVDIPIEGRFTVDAVALVESELLPGGARYSTVATFTTVRSA